MAYLYSVGGAVICTLGRSRAEAPSRKGGGKRGGNFGKDLRVFIPLSDGEFAQFRDRELRVKLGPARPVRPCQPFAPQPPARGAARLLGFGRRFSRGCGDHWRGCRWPTAAEGGAGGWRTNAGSDGALHSRVMTGVWASCGLDGFRGRMPLPRVCIGKLRWLEIRG